MWIRIMWLKQWFAQDLILWCHIILKLNQFNSQHRHSAWWTVFFFLLDGELLDGDQRVVFLIQVHRVHSWAVYLLLMCWGPSRSTVRLSKYENQTQMIIKYKWGWLYIFYCEKCGLIRGGPKWAQNNQLTSMNFEILLIYTSLQNFAKSENNLTLFGKSNVIIYLNSLWLYVQVK